MHRCYACERTTSWSGNWYSNEDGHYLCGRCYQQLIRRPHRFQTKEERNEFFRQNNKGQVPPNKGKRLRYKRHCYACGSSKTMVDKTGRRHWMLNHDGNFLCHKCKMHFIANPERKRQIWLVWRGKQIPLKYDPRTGFCSECGKVGQTQLHHTSYESDNPLDNTVELCISCHGTKRGKAQTF